MIRLKTDEQIAIMQEGGQKLSQILRLLISQAKPGASTAEIDQAGENLIRRMGGEPAFKNYRAFGITQPFSGSICTSINNEIVHGEPYPERILKEGDVVTIDIGMKYKGYFTDMAYTVGVGKITPEHQKLLQVTEQSLRLAIEAMREKVEKADNFDRLTTNDVGTIVQNFIEGAKFNIVRELSGHGLGENLHEDPIVPNYNTGRTGEYLPPGTVIAVEPMVYEGKSGVVFEEDGWPVYTAHGGYAAHFEKTLAITQETVLEVTPDINE